MMTEPILIEHVADPDGAYDQHWTVGPPALGIAFRVIEDEWNDHTVRVIRKIETLPFSSPRYWDKRP